MLLHFMYKVVYTLSSKVVCWKHSKEALLVVSMRNIWFLEFLEFYLSVLLVGWLVGWEFARLVFVIVIIG